MRNKFLSCLMLVCLIVAALGSGLSSAAFAASIKVSPSSTALADLQATADWFDIADYPSTNDSDTTMELIHVAEGAKTTDSNGYLYMYVYTPGRKLLALDGSASVNGGDSHVFDLELVGELGVLSKYKSDIEISFESNRSYTINWLYRWGIRNLDDDRAIDQAGQVHVKVNKTFTFNNDALDNDALDDTLVVDDKYSTPIQDLSKDESFDESQYPLVVGDRSLDVIQIAESADGELFVYVYQPGGKSVSVSSINICQDSTNADERHWYNYKLTICSIQNAIGKYKVEGITLKSNEPLRYYDITSIYRLPFDDEVTSAVVKSSVHLASATLPNGNIINEVPYEIARCYMAVTVNGEVLYDVKYTEVVEITKKLCGSIRYSNGFTLYNSACDSWWVAFSCDHSIDQLYEADVYFVWEEWAHSRNGIGMGSTWKSNEGSKTVTLVYSETASNPAQGLFGHKYTWNRIESAELFLQNNLEDDTKAAFAENGYKWVLRFYESDYGNFEGGSQGTITNWTVVSDVTILRLMFETNGKVYNLGVVDNKQVPDQRPDNTDTSPWDGAKLEWEQFLEDLENFFNRVGDFFRQFWWLLLIPAGLIVLGILSIFFPVLRVVFKGIWIGLKWLVKILWYIISAPVRLIMLIVKKAKERKDNSG